MELEGAKLPANDEEAQSAATSDANERNLAIPEPLVLRSGQSEAIVSVASKKPRRMTKRGWGPFQSVVKERSVDFNLTLDVNSLRQEVQHLTSVRDLERSKSLIKRYSPEGSLAKMVQEYFRVFHRGAGAASSPTSLVDKRRHRARSADTGTISDEAARRGHSQLQFLRQMMDEHVDFGCEACGPDALYDFIQRTSTQLRMLTISLDSLEVFNFGETVIVETRTTLCFQVTIATIKARFPHVNAYTRLVTSLLGQNIEARGRILFYFDEKDKCIKISCDVDFVDAFSEVLEPRDLAAVLHANHIDGRVDYALPRRPGTEAESSRIHQHTYHQLDAIPVLPYRHFREDDWQNTYPQVLDSVLERPLLTRSSSSNTLNPTALTFHPALDLVNEFIRSFDSAFTFFDPDILDHHARIDSIRAFMSRSFTSDMRYGHHLAGWGALERRWALLCNAFELHGFRADGPLRDVTTANIPPNEPRIIVVRTVYSLHITLRTIGRVFPRLLLAQNTAIQRQLLGQTLSVTANLTFSLEMARSRPLIARIDEREHFSAALRSLLLPLRSVDVDAVLADARLVENGLEGAADRESIAALSSSRVRSSSEPAGDRLSQARMSFSDLVGD